MILSDLAKYSMTQSFARFLCDSWDSCVFIVLLKARAKAKKVHQRWRVQREDDRFCRDVQLPNNPDMQLDPCFVMCVLM